MERAKVAQHLELEDVVAWGLGAADLTCLAAGIAVSWSLASTMDGPLALRVAVAAPALLVGGTFALLRIGGRDLRAWTVVLIRFALRPRLLRTEARRCG